MTDKLNISKQINQIDKMQLSILQRIFDKKIAPVLKKYDLELVWAMGSVFCIDAKLTERWLSESVVLQALNRQIEHYLDKLHLCDYRNTSLWILLNIISEGHGTYYHIWGFKPFETKWRPRIKGRNYKTT